MTADTLPAVRIESGRCRELLALKWHGVHLVDRYVRLHDTKNGDSRDILLSESAFTMLKHLPRDISSQVIPTTAEAVKLAFVRAIERAGIANLRFHDLRHETRQLLKRYYQPRANDLAGKLG